MPTFVVLWISAFATLVLSLAMLSVYFRLLGSELRLKSLRRELWLALVTSAGQAGGYLAVVLLVGNSVHSRLASQAEIVVPALLTMLLYKITHLVEWDQFELPGLLSFQFVLCFALWWLAVGDVRLVVLVLSVFATALLVIGGLARQA